MRGLLFYGLAQKTVRLLLLAEDAQRLLLGFTVKEDIRSRLYLKAFIDLQGSYL